MKISPLKVAVALSLIVCGLVSLYLVSQALNVYGGYDGQLGFARQFDLDGENNIPSWYASSALFFCALLLGVIGYVKRREQDQWAGQWVSLAAIFFYLSMDEAASLHEMVNPLARAVLDRAGLDIGYFHYSWVILGLIVVPIVGVSYLRFLFALPITTRLQFIIAGTLYVGGAVGIEMFGGQVASQGGVGTMPYAALVAVEEGCEMFGVVTFCYALLSYIRQPVMAASLLQMHEAASGDMVSSSFTGAQSGGRIRSNRVA